MGQPVGRFAGASVHRRQEQRDHRHSEAARRAAAQERSQATKTGIKNRRLTAGPVVLTAPPSYVCDISCDCAANLSPLHNGSNLNEQGAWQRQGLGRSVEVSGNRLLSRAKRLGRLSQPKLRSAPSGGRRKLVIGGTHARQTYRRGRRGSRVRRPVRIARRRRVHRRLTVRRSRVATAGRRRRSAARRVARRRPIRVQS